MILVIPAKAAEAAMLGDLQYDGATGQAMHLRLSQAVPTPRAGRVQVEAAPDEWVALQRWCERRSKTPYGAPAPERRLAEAAATTARRITQGLDRLAKHPAYRGRAIVGDDTTVLPAYRMGSTRWWPSVSLALRHASSSVARMEATTLVPRRVVRGGRVFTSWEAEESTAGGEVEHAVEVDL